MYKNTYSGSSRVQHPFLFYNTPEFWFQVVPKLMPVVTYQPYCKRNVLFFKLKKQTKPDVTTGLFKPFLPEWMKRTTYSFFNWNGETVCPMKRVLLLFLTTTHWPHRRCRHYYYIQKEKKKNMLNWFLAVTYFHNTRSFSFIIYQK